MQNFLNEIQGHMDVISGLCSGFTAAVNELNARAERLKPLAEEHDRVAEQLAEKLADLAVAEKKLSDVKELHAKFHKAATSI